MLPDGFRREMHHRDGLGDIGLAAALPDLFLVALHGEGRHSNDRGMRQFPSSLSHLVTSKPEISGNWISIKDQVGRVGARKGYRLQTSRVCSVLSPVEQIMKELHVQLVILDDEDFLGHYHLRPVRPRPGTCCACSVIDFFDRNPARSSLCSREAKLVVRRLWRNRPLARARFALLEGARVRSGSP